MEEVDEPLLVLPQVDFDRAARKEAVVGKKAFINPQLQQAEFDKSYLAETARCLECNFICDKCVEVCPNRANIAIEVDSPYVDDLYQILHMDALCNECGNCATFCVHRGEPYADKPRLFLEEADFRAADDNAFHIDGDTIRRRMAGREARLAVQNGTLLFEDDAVRLVLSPDFEVAEMALKEAFEDTRSLRNAAEMALIFEGVRRSLPFVLVAGA
jgi:putative selenate reductase